MFKRGNRRNIEIGALVLVAIALIILDIIMEETDSGFQVAQKLGGDIPIIMLSSIAGASAQVFDTSSLPIADLLDKPIDPDVLLEKIGKVLG